MALLGLRNEQEFYSDYYLEAIFKGDLKEVQARWKRQAEQDPATLQPDRALAGLRRSWLNLCEQEADLPAAHRLLLQREQWFRPLLAALGYSWQPQAKVLLINDQPYQLPVLATEVRSSGEPLLWVLEAFNPVAASSDDLVRDPLQLEISGHQIRDPSQGTVLPGENWEQLINNRVFAQDDPPRWLLLLSRDELLLIDRFKWGASRLLRFEVGTLYAERQADAFLAAATLLHSEHLCPSEGGTPLLDSLDENSHKHAYEVSGDLKYALRKSIELLGNEAVWHIRYKQKDAAFQLVDEKQLSDECLRFMYRLLFLFYIEARPELNYIPIGSEVYRRGYSLERLRDLEQVPLLSDEDRESTYIHDSLLRLFQMIWEGYPKRDDSELQVQLSGDGSGDIFADSFRITPLKSHLFDPSRMPLLGGVITKARVRFRNGVLRDVIELMSLTKTKAGRKRGRVSYAQLGINQLGSVYEALLSFRGFFAPEDLYEVQPAPKKATAPADDEDFDAEASSDAPDDEPSDDDETGVQARGKAHDELKVGHFVPRSQLGNYKREEIVPNAEGTGPKLYEKGTFIYRLAGRDRIKSASYYTPESLTRCQIKYTLKELLPGKTAADILRFKLLEMALGSAAYLNELINQLALKYLELRQQELSKTIPHADFEQELQKVKMRLADRNVFGVDLNPVAIELAEVSLWLNSIYQPEQGRAFVPWFGQQLLCGNSLVGCRRQIYRLHQLPQEGKKGKPAKAWHEQAPEELAWDQELPDDAIFHFLLPDPGMAIKTNAVIKELLPEQVKTISSWKKTFSDKPFSGVELRRLQRLSRIADGLMQDWAEQLAQIRERTTDPLPVWGNPEADAELDWKPLSLKDRIQSQEVAGEGITNANARLRLKLAMDYWCALWFWPLEQAGQLPSREEWINDLSCVLGDIESVVDEEEGQLQLLPDTQPKQLAANFNDRHGYVNKAKLLEEIERLLLAEQVASRIRPLHWDLEFADLLACGGFDLIVGNPPWIPARSSLSDIASDIDPIFSVRPLSAASAEAKILSELGKFNDDERMVTPLSNSESERNFYSAPQNYPATARAKPNLYKLFLEQSQRLRRDKSALGLLHPEGLFIEKEAIDLRNKIYSSLKYLFIFRNTLFLFPDIEDSRVYTISVCGEKAPSPRFNMIAGLIHPDTVDGCFARLEVGSADPMVLSHLDWKKQLLAPLAERVLPIDEQALGLFARLLGESSQGSTTQRLVFLTSTRQYHLLKALDQIEDRLENVLAYSSSGLNERFAQRDGLLEESIGFPDSISSLVLAGPHVFTGNGLAKTPNRVCKSTNDYTALDFTLLPSGYLPRSCFRPTNSFAKGDLLSINDVRLVLKRRLDSQTERTLQAAIVPPGPLLTNTLTFATGKTLADLIYALGVLSSIPFDAYIKLSGCNDIYASQLNSLPLPSSTGSIQSEIFSRACRLAFTSPLMDDFLLSKDISEDSLKAPKYCKGNFGENMTRESLIKLRYDYSFHARRKDLVDIDVLVCMLIGLGLEDLIYIYESLFHRLRRAEAATWYDRNGRIVFTASKGLTGVGFPRKGSGRGANKTTGWEDIAAMTSGTVSRTIIDDTLPGGPVERTITYEAPFDRCDRVHDYRIAWEFFEIEGASA
jgi:hypothetical protein